MICSICNGQVIWKGPFSNLTHTECQQCGGTNCQTVPEDQSDLEDEVRQREQEEWDALSEDY